MSHTSVVTNGLMAWGAVWMLISYINGRMPKRRDEN